MGRHLAFRLLVAASAMACLAGLAIACASSNSIATYTDSSYGFSLTYPASWLSDVDDTNFAALFNGMGGVDYTHVIGTEDLRTIVVVAATRQAVPATTLKASRAELNDWAQQFKAARLDVAPDTEFESASAASLGGLNGYHVVYRNPQIGTEYSEYHLYGKNVVYTVVAASGKSASSEDMARLAEVTRSFRASAADRGLTQAEPSSEQDAVRIYLERVVRDGKELARARALADRCVAAESEGKSGMRYLREANRLMRDLANSWDVGHAPSLPAASLDGVESKWLESLFYWREAVSYLIKANSAGADGDLSKVWSAARKSMRYRKRAWFAQEALFAAVRRSSAGFEVAGLTAELGINPYNFGEDEKVAYRKSLWGEYLAEARQASPDMTKVDELKAQFDDVLMRRWVEEQTLNDWVSVPYIAYNKSQQ